MLSQTATYKTFRINTFSNIEKLSKCVSKALGKQTFHISSHGIEILSS